MPLSIPFDHPALVLGNIIDPELSGTIEEIQALQSGIDAAQHKMGSYVAMKRNLTTTINELINVNVDGAAIRAKIQDVESKLAEAAEAYITVRLANEEAIQQKIEKIAGMAAGDGVESPIDFVRTDIKCLPLAADSMTFDAQYFSYDQPGQGGDPANTVADITAYIRDSTSDLGTRTAAKLAKTAGDQLSQQTKLHSLAGTLILSATCAHQKAAILTPLVLDADKAAAAWNYYYPQDQIDTGDPEKLTTEKPDGSKDAATLTLLTGVNRGSSFIGMVHLLNSRPEVQNGSEPSLTDLAAGLQERLTIRNWLSESTGSLGAATGIIEEITQMLNLDKVNAHVTLLTMGAVPSIRSNQLELGLKSLIRVDPAKISAKLAALDNAAQAEQKTIDQRADAARTGAKMMALESSTVQTVLGELGRIDGKFNRLLDINSLMTAFDNYIQETKRGECGIPVSYTFKKFSRMQIARLWLDKYFPEAKLNGNGGSQNGHGAKELAEQPDNEAGEKAARETVEQADNGAEDKAARNGATPEENGTAEKAAIEKGAEQTVRETVEKAAREAAEGAARESSEQADNSTAAKADEERAEQTVREAVEKAAREAAEKAALEAAEQAENGAEDKTAMNGATPEENGRTEKAAQADNATNPASDEVDEMPIDGANDPASDAAENPATEVTDETVIDGTDKLIEIQKPEQKVVVAGGDPSAKTGRTENSAPITEKTAKKKPAEPAPPANKTNIVKPPVKPIAGNPEQDKSKTPGQLKVELEKAKLEEGMKSMNAEQYIQANARLEAIERFENLKANQAPDAAKKWQLLPPLEKEKVMLDARAGSMTPEQFFLAQQRLDALEKVENLKANPKMQPTGKEPAKTPGQLFVENEKAKLNERLKSMPATQYIQEKARLEGMERAENRKANPPAGLSGGGDAKTPGQLKLEREKAALDEKARMMTAKEFYRHKQLLDAQEKAEASKTNPATRPTTTPAQKAGENAEKSRKDTFTEKIKKAAGKVPKK